MANYINKYTNIEAYNADDGKQYPNVSYLVDEDILKWEKNDPVHIVAVYNVTSTSEATTLLYSSTGITYQIIDDVKQDTVQATYTFNTLGKHTVKYKLDGTSISNNAFQNCTGLTSVTIPNSVTSIGINAFQNCSGLTSVTIPNSVTSIGNYAFYYCTGLTSVTIPNSVTSIGNGAFYYCYRLTSVTIPDSVTSIGDYAFYNCTDLTSVTIPNSVTSIGDNAFESCEGLPSVEIPNSVTSIGINAFGDCSKLSTITINATTPPTFGSIYSMEFYIFVPSESVDAYKATNALKEHPNNIYSLPILKGEYLTGTIEIASYRDFALSDIFYKKYPKYFDKLYINDIEVSTDYSLKQHTSYTFKFELFDKRLIGGRLFSDNDFVTSVTIPDSVTRIGNNAFVNCKITNINIPESVTNIGHYAFQSTALTEITIPSSVTEIGYNILEYNNVITSITILATTPPTLSSNSISGNNCPIYVPSESVDAYKAATNWSNLADRIQAIPTV